MIVKQGARLRALLPFSWRRRHGTIWSVLANPDYFLRPAKCPLPPKQTSPGEHVRQVPDN